MCLWLWSLISLNHSLSLYNIFAYLQGEKASAEREIKRLHSQNSLLERDMNKRESLAGRRRDSVNDKGLKTSDPKRAKNLAFEQTLQVLKMMSSLCSFIMHHVGNTTCKLF